MSIHSTALILHPNYTDPSVFVKDIARKEVRTKITQIVRNTFELLDRIEQLPIISREQRISDRVLLQIQDYMKTVNTIHNQIETLRKELNGAKRGFEVEFAESIGSTTERIVSVNERCITKMRLYTSIYNSATMKNYVNTLILQYSAYDPANNKVNLTGDEHLAQMRQKMEALKGYKESVEATEKSWKAAYLKGGFDDELRQAFIWSLCSLDNLKKMSVTWISKYEAGIEIVRKGMEDLLSPESEAKVGDGITPTPPVKRQGSRVFTFDNLGSKKGQ